jgi:hypothetical protein
MKSVCVCVCVREREREREREGEEFGKINFRFTQTIVYSS